MATASRTELLDSLLHTNVKRVFVGIFCGFAAGVLLLLATTFLKNDPQAPALWWLHLMGSAFFGGPALAYDAPDSFVISGALFHFFLSGLCGFAVGKMTTTGEVKKLAGYGLVLGGLCWLASNMFGTDFLNIYALEAVGQWTRVFLFVLFGVSLGVFMALASKALKV